MSVSIGDTSFKLHGKKLFCTFRGEWMMVFQVGVLENRGDLAIDYDPNSPKGELGITKRSRPLKKGWNRFQPTNDIVFFKLENGRTLTLEMNPPMYELVQELYIRGLVKSVGKDCSKQFANRMTGKKS